MVGSQLGPYRIDAEIAAGGMGVVYRARDTRLDRSVAIKVLGGDRDRAPARVLREARAASRLSHPNICTVHDVGEADGTAFIVMELVEGRTLSGFIPPGGLSTGEIVSHARQIADALAHAHAQGLVHRDLKPANVLVTPMGHVKVCDFGLAQSCRSDSDTTTMADASLESGSAVAGTPAYMAPEVLRGQPATTRADVWAFGVLLYEMCTGVRPFQGTTAFELTSAILTHTPVALPASVPPALSATALRCLQKEPARRYRDGGELVAALEAIVLTPSRQAAETRRVQAIAVLPFVDLTRDPADACLGLGLADAIITDLALVRSLVVRPTPAIASYEGQSTDVAAAGGALGVDAVVSGSFQRAGSRLRVTVQLVCVADGRSLWSTKVTLSVADLFQLQDDVARAIVDALQVELTQADEGRLANAARPAASDEALVAYLDGRRALLTEALDDINRAIELFERAVALAPDFAQAYAGLADAYARLAFTFLPEGDHYARAQAMSLKALALDPALPEGRYVRGRLLWCPDGGFDHDGALREFLAAVAGRPNLNEAHDWIGIVLLHLGMTTECEHHLRRALEINPQDLIALLHLATSRYYAGDFHGSLAFCQEAARRDSSLWLMYQTALCRVQLGDLADADRLADQASRRHPSPVLMDPVRGLIAALRGDGAAARRQIETTVRNRRAYGHYHHAQYDVACIYAILGQHDEAVEWLGAASANGFPCAEFFDRDPLLSAIRSDPRYMAITSDARAECARYRETYRAHRELASG